LQVQLQDVPPLIHPLHAQSLRCHGGLDRDRLDCAQKLTSKGRIDACTAKGQATRGAEHKVWAVAAIAAARASIIGDLEAAAASGATKQTDQQRLAAATGLDLADTAVGVRCELLLVPLELSPVDVAFVMILEHDLPFLERPFVSVGLLRTPIDDRRAVFALPVDVGAGVEGVLEDRYDVAIADRRPVEGDHSLAVGRSRKMQVIRRQGQENLPRAAQLAEAREDETDRLLEPHVGVEAEAHLAVPHVTNRHTDPQLAAPRLGSHCVVHSGAQDAEFELADAALHAQEKTVVRAAGVINPVEIDDARAYKTAKLQQVMPVAPVASEPRSVETQHGADIAGAEPRHQSIEARPRHRPARRSPEIVVDNLHVAEASAARFVDQLILAALTFEVGLDLALRRLPDVHDGFPLQDRRWKKVSAGHRRPPPAGRRPPPAS
jgi:hypothetical protein